MERADRILVVVGSAVLLFLLSGVGYGLAPPSLGVTIAALATSAMFVVLAFGLVTLRPTSRSEVKQRLGLVPGRLGWPVVLLAVAGTLALSNLLEGLIAQLHLSEVGTLGKIDADLAGVRGPNLGGALAAVALAAGAAEELFFRGYAQRGMERRFGGRRGGATLALVVASIAFALAHFDPVHSPAAFVLGLYLGGIARIADSLWPAILCHVSNNVVAVLDSAFTLEWPASGWALAALDIPIVAGSLIVALSLRKAPLMHSPGASPKAATADPSTDRP